MIPDWMIPDWMRDALCAQTDPEIYFPDKGGMTKAVKRTCLACDVREECLTYALDNGIKFGVWGGLSEHQRQKLRPGGPDTCEICHGPMEQSRNKSRRYCSEPCATTAHNRRRGAA